MSKQNKLVYFVGFFVISFFIIFNICFFTLQAQAGDPNEEGDTYININQDTIWHSMNLKKAVSVNPGATLTIEKGAKIKFGKDVKGGDTYLSVNGGRLIASGTQEEPISITADANQQYYLLEFRRNYWKGVPESLPSFLRYVEIYGGGYAWDTDCPECISLFRNLIPMAHASIEGSPAMFFTGGKVHLENCTFHDNEYADVEVQYDEFDSSTGVDNYLEIINSNFEKNGNSIAVKSKLWCKETGYGCASKILLKNNWYGHFQGPTKESDSTIKGEKIVGDYTLNGYRNNDLISDPAIIIPGIMGSFEVGGKMFLDPVLKIYDNLKRSLEQNGYQKDINLFEFPYEWRDSNKITAGELKNKIQEIKNLTKVSKIDLVAHSMGGLISRSYIEGVNYQNDVDQLITLGTPHKGSPEAYLKWEAAEGFEDPLDKVAKAIFRLEAYHAEPRYTDLKKYIQEKVKSVGELLPDYKYLEENGVPRDYPTGYPGNEFLESLNTQSNLSNLKKIDFTNIISKNKSTITKFRVETSTEDGKWEHGMPENYYNSENNPGIEYGDGDETVPSVSSTGIVSDKTIEMPDSTHSQLPSRAQCKILAELSNKTEKNCLYINDVSEIISILTFGVFSPIDIQVIDPNDKRVGKDFDDPNGGIINEIDGAYYTGAGAENEFLTIPNPIDGEYKILTQGTGDGEYKIEVAKITEDPTTGAASESVAEITGTAATGSREEKSLTIGDGEKWDDVAIPAIAGSETVYARDSGDESDNDSEKDAKKDEKNSSSGNFQEQLAGKNDIFRNISDAILGTTAQGKILSGSDGKPDAGNLSGRKEEDRKFVIATILVILISVAFEIIFPAFRRRINKKV